jgi:hypothetical protein
VFGRSPVCAGCREKSCKRHDFAHLLGHKLLVGNALEYLCWPDVSFALTGDFATTDGESSMPRSATYPQRRFATARVALAVVALGLAGSALLPAAPAQARGFVGLSLGLPLGGPAYYPAYYPPAYYYGPPPAYYAPPPVAYAPPPTAYAQPPAPAGDGCREYQSTATIDGRPTATHGVACRQPDGSWRIVQ